MSNGEYAGFIYARMTSKRFPKKPFQTLAGDKIIDWVINRSRKSRLDKLVLLTTSNPSDTPLADYASSCGLMVFRGDPENLVKRTIDALDKMDFTGFFRLNGDSPFVDSDLLNLGIGQLMNGLDFVTNLERRTHPYGISAEGISSEIYREMAHKAYESELEHVCAHFYRYLPSLRHASIFNSRATEEISRATIDTPEDLVALSSKVSSFEEPMRVSYWQILGLSEPSHEVEVGVT